MQVPLVEDRKRNPGIMLCVSCSKQYVREKDVEEGKFSIASPSAADSLKQTPTSTTSTLPTTTSTQGDNKSAPSKDHTNNYEDYEDDDDWVPPTAEELKEIEATRKRNDEISAKLSQKLMQGWAM